MYNTIHKVHLTHLTDINDSLPGLKMKLLREMEIKNVDLGR